MQVCAVGIRLGKRGGAGTVFGKRGLPLGSVQVVVDSRDGELGMGKD